MELCFRFYSVQKTHLRALHSTVLWGLCLVSRPCLPSSAEVHNKFVTVSRFATWRELRKFLPSILPPQLSKIFLIARTPVTRKRWWSPLFSFKLRALADRRSSISRSLTWKTLHFGPCALTRKITCIHANTTEGFKLSEKEGIRVVSDKMSYSYTEMRWGKKISHDCLSNYDPS